MVSLISLLTTGVAVLVSLAAAQDVGFALDGALQGASAESTAFNAGGRISVNGWTVIVPKNLQVGFPAAWVPWKDFVANIGSFKDFEVSVCLAHPHASFLQQVAGML